MTTIWPTLTSSKRPDLMHSECTCLPTTWSNKRPQTFKTQERVDPSTGKPERWIPRKRLSAWRLRLSREYSKRRRLYSATFFVRLLSNRWCCSVRGSSIGMSGGIWGRKWEWNDVNVRMLRGCFLDLGIMLSFELRMLVELLKTIAAFAFVCTRRERGRQKEEDRKKRGSRRYRIAGGLGWVSVCEGFSGETTRGVHSGAFMVIHHHTWWRVSTWGQSILQF